MLRNEGENVKIKLSRKRRIVSVLLGLCIMLLAAGCGKRPASARETPPVGDAGPDGLMTISTRYGDLYFSDQWGEDLHVEQSSSGSTEIVAFAADIDGQTYSLFRVMIVGDAEDCDDSDAVGVLTDRQGVRREVFIRMDPLPEGEQPDRLYALRDGVNELIDHLK